ncbi:hypothetical protein CEXT_238081 [Caerostris extrusa]|uniref:Uncharacterized protein n=1 Tax=Caerostris extrusa TaxID=172846 RepID=A0AAV4QQV5_CAEEX|nr:hypothetical protein CEXT_238081 [Caerostris extrusa]
MKHVFDNLGKKKKKEEMQPQQQQPAVLLLGPAQTFHCLSGFTCCSNRISVIIANAREVNKRKKSSPNSILNAYLVIRMKISAWGWREEEMLRILEETKH